MEWENDAIADFQYDEFPLHQFLHIYIEPFFLIFFSMSGAWDMSCLKNARTL